MATLSFEELEQIKADVHFFLDAFGSTKAVRRKLRQQQSDIQRLEGCVGRLQGRSGKISDKASNPIETLNAEETESSDSEADEVSRIHKDVEFFLKQFGSTTAAREKLESQKKEIVGLQRTVRWLEDRERKRRRAASVEEERGDSTADSRSLQPPRPKRQSLGAFAAETFSELQELTPLEASSLRNSVEHRRTEFRLRPHRDLDAQDEASPLVGSPGSSNTPRSHKTCQAGRCRKWVMHNGDHPLYCSEHQDWQDSNSAAPVVPENPRGHKTCKFHGCMKWVKRIDSIYCVLHHEVSGGDAQEMTKEVSHDTSATLQKKALKSSKHKRPICKEPGCGGMGIYGGLKPGNCARHGGGPRCKHPGCTKQRQRKGLCVVHGGWKKCRADGCRRLGCDDGFCAAHREAASEDEFYDTD